MIATMSPLDEHFIAWGLIFLSKFVIVCHLIKFDRAKDFDHFIIGQIASCNR